MIAAGFEVHHADGNHHNDDPKNLVLIEGVDHHKLHGKTLFRPPRHCPIDPVLGARAYQLKDLYDLAWVDIAEELGIKNAPTAAKFARVYAYFAGKPWGFVPARRAKKRYYKRPTYRGY